MVAAHIIAYRRKYTRVQRPCFNKVNHFHCSGQNVFQAVRHFLGSKSLSVDAVVYPSGVREQLLARALPLHYFVAFVPSQCIYQHLDHQSLFDVTKLSSTLKISSSCCPGFIEFTGLYAKQ